MDSVKEFAGTAEGMKLLQRERLGIELTELICESMEAKSITRAQLARRLKTSRAHVTQMLRDGSNMTVKSIADVFTALDLSLRLVSRPLSVSSHPLLVLEAPRKTASSTGNPIEAVSTPTYSFAMNKSRAAFHPHGDNGSADRRTA